MVEDEVALGQRLVLVDVVVDLCADVGELIQLNPKRRRMDLRRVSALADSSLI